MAEWHESFEGFTAISSDVHVDSMLVLLVPGAPLVAQMNPM